MATIQTSEMQRVSGVFNCADMPGETASLNNTSGAMCATLRAMFTAHQEEKRRAEGEKKASSPWSTCPSALRQMFEAEQKRRKKAAQEEAERKAHVCKSG